jgi:hypothetical protein
MDNIEALIEAPHTPYARLKTLRNMEEVDLLLPSSIEQHCCILCRGCFSRICQDRDGR